MAGCRAVAAYQDSVMIDNQLSEQDLFDLSPDFFRETCLDVLEKFEYQYHNRGIDTPDYAATRLGTFTVKTAAHSSHIERIDIKFTFDDGDKVHGQSVVIQDGKVSSFISSSPRTTSPDPDIHTISLSAFIEAIEGLDFGQFTEINKNADLYTIDMEAVSDVFYNNEGNVIRYLVSMDDMIDGNRQDDIQLDHYVPVLLFCDYMQSTQDRFSGGNAVKIFINK